MKKHPQGKKQSQKQQPKITGSSSSTSSEQVSNTLLQSQSKISSDPTEGMNLVGAHDQTKGLHYSCLHFWKKFSGEFTNWWKQLSEGDRKTIMLEISPDMKEEPPLDYHDNEFTDSLLPELFWKSLSKSEPVLTLCTFYCTLSLEKLEELEYKRMYSMLSTTFKNIQMPYGKFTAYHDGQFYTLKKNATEDEARRFLAATTSCDANAYFLVHQRMSILLSVLSLLMGEFFERKGEEGAKMREDFEKSLEETVKEVKQ